MSAKSHTQAQAAAHGLIAAVALVATTGGCGLVAGIDDRELYTGATGGQGGSTSSGGGDQGGLGGEGGGCAPPAGGWPDSKQICFGGVGGACPEGEDGALLNVAPDYEFCPGEEIVHDKVTDLYWQRVAHGGSSSPFEWEDADAYCSNLSLGGMENWEIPVLRDLVSLANFGLSSPMIDNKFSQEANSFWARQKMSANQYWVVHFERGRVTFWHKSGALGSLMVRCVHGGPTSSNFVPSQSDPTVIDTTLGLEWLMTTSGQLTWQSSLNYCNNLPAAGGGWRMPNIKELLTIYRTTIPPSFPDPFESQPLNSYWSSTPDQGGASEAYAVHYDPANLTDGAARREDATSVFLARCVRNAPQ
ncbi:MAG: hypothetical protein DRI90_26295 [Deltaproteobacteria bacterium]|nr:MAG: hypothetical protein DRI90_26295 [Deltaproteobacteria bacterium]